MAKESKQSEAAAVLSTGTDAAAGAVSAFAGVSAGAAAGTSGAAALTSGLATLGAIVGGGMTAGLVVVAAAPVVGGATMFGVYKLYKHMASKT
ncbi:hypothetical protein LYZ77_18560 [Xanthomonas hortorum pv. vitians]|uniref:hypothetical protein n=1 Tax=Xanthomonas hortorum TaxID=56454 RepID=UPI0012A9200E|nr:hypothetical protein [Xanthomonas hortorum]MCE4282757.1 hypothetical protein [Xanthomonas hortorum pv. vitians]MCE4286861.1 hypothetical protein [Xanthomonas hortorum pv. vitians]MCE4287965.1 hypothetical protein [Xanthomonas hortorum pv. vitians]MCE4295664.1 hypothetical protein [Xanthomonas hortorum pv. vitians]MDT7854277.1 hypothetical protein [Xanthomonas hortorum pv. vitians]